MLKEFEYNVGENPELFRIGASSFSTFVEKPWRWYKEQVLNLDGFEGNTSSVIGTICHVAAERVAKQLDFTKEHVEEFLTTIDNPEVDKDEVRNSYPEMAKALVNSYVLAKKPSMYEVEPFLELDLGDGISAGGSIDRVEAVSWDTSKTENNKYKPISVRICDYKTYNSKTKPKQIPQHYKYQLLVYAYVYNKIKGIPVEEVRLIYVNRPIDGGFSEKTGKPLKSYPSEVTVLTEQISQSDLDFIESLIYLAKEKLLATEKYPELSHLLWHAPKQYFEE